MSCNECNEINAIKLMQWKECNLTSACCECISEFCLKTPYFVNGSILLNFCFVKPFSHPEQIVCYYSLSHLIIISSNPHDHHHCWLFTQSSITFLAWLVLYSSYSTSRPAAQLVLWQLSSTVPPHSYHVYSCSKPGLFSEFRPGWLGQLLLLYFLHRLGILVTL